MIPFPKIVERLEEGRAKALKALRAADALAELVADPSTTSRRKARGLLKLGNAILEAKLEGTVAVADERRLRDARASAGEAAASGQTSALIAEQWNIQKRFVAEVSEAVTRLEQLRAKAALNEAVSRASNQVKKARTAMARTGATAERAVALSSALLARKLDK